MAFLELGRSFTWVCMTFHQLELTILISSATAGEVDLKDVSLANSPESNIKTVLDTQLVAASQQIGDDWMSLDTAETVGLKADYAKRNGLGGVFFWTSYGDQSREESLIAAAAKILYHAQGPL